MVKVLHIISDLNVAGAQTVVMNYVRNMAKDSAFETYVAVTGTYNGSIYEQECKKYGYNVIYTNYKYCKNIPLFGTIINWIIYQIRLYKTIKGLSPDIIHSHVTPILPYIIIPLFLTKAKVKFHTLHSDPYAIDDKFVRWAKLAFKIFRVYPICVTQDQAMKAKERYGIKKLAIIPNGIDLNRYKISESKNSIRESIGVSKDAFVIGCISRLDKIKNFEFLVSVFAEIKKIRSNALLLLIGEGGEKQSIINLATSLGINDSIILTGVRNDVERMYKAFDVFMLTSFSESSSIATVEAQLSGIRCVVSSGVPSNVVITNQVNRISLDASIKQWIEAILDELPKETTIYPAESFSIIKSINSLKELYRKKLLEK